MFIKAVKPYIYPNQLNFKDKPYEAWKRVYGEKMTVEGYYPKWLHGLWFRYDLCGLFAGFRITRLSNHQTSRLSDHQITSSARLVFVQPVSLYFDAGFSVLRHEVIPMFWDCWPCYYDKVERWMKRHRVKRAVFTSRQEMEAMQARCPEVKMLWCPEAIDVEGYGEGKPLTERSIDVLEFGRGFLNGKHRQSAANQSPIKYVNTQVDGKFIYSDAELRAAMGDAKITVCVPRSMTDPALAEGVETLTQRYWEAMLSRMLIVGHCPQELIDLIGYNPVVELDTLDQKGGFKGLLDHIGDYQALVDKNRATALKYGDWTIRMEKIFSAV